MESILALKELAEKALNVEIPVNKTALAVVLGGIGSIFVAKMIYNGNLSKGVSSKRKIVKGLAQSVACTTTLAITGCAVLYFAEGSEGEVDPVSHMIAYSLLYPVLFWTYDFTFNPSAAGKNLKSLNDHGYSNATIATIGVVDGLILGLTGAFMGYMFKGYREHVDLKLFGGLLANLTISDLFFRWAHKNILHLWVPSIHLMHHFTRYGDLAPTVLFHPLDLVVELGVPVVTVLSTYAITRDKFCGMISTALILMWYEAEHEENLNWAHSTHHKIISGYYGVYFPVHDGKVECELKKMMKDAEVQPEIAIAG